LACEGQITLETVPILRQSIGDILGKGVKGQTILIDLTKVSSLSKDGLFLLIRTQEQCQEVEVTLKLVVPEGPIKKVFEFAGLEGKFNIYASSPYTRRFIG